MLAGMLLVLASCIPVEEPDPWYDDEAPSDGQVGDAGSDDGGGEQVDGGEEGDGGGAETDGGSADGGAQDGGGDDGGSEDGGGEDTSCEPGAGEVWAPFRVLVGPAESVAGEAIAAADLDGDGADELIVGAPWAATEDGAMFVVSGTGSSGSLDDLGVRVSGDDRGQLGTAVAAGLDLAGDAHVDIVVGAPDTDPYSEIFVFAGPITGDLGTSSAVATVTSECSGATLGASLALLDDTDGSGTVGFLAVSTYCEGHHDDPNQGDVWLIEGPVSGSLGVNDADWTLVAAGGFDSLSGSVLAEDIDGDGVSDVVLGATANLGALVFLGPLRGDAEDGDADATLTGTTGSGELHVLSAADLDGDGSADLLIGEPDAEGGGSRHGAVYVWTDAVKDGNLEDAASSVHGSADNDKLGRAGTAVASDDEVVLVLAAQGADTASTTDNSGAVYLIPCIDTGVQGLDAASWIAMGSSGVQLGDTVSTADVDGDGTVELVVGDRYGSEWAGQVWLLALP